MVSNKSLDEIEIIAALLHDVHNAHGLVFNTRSLKNTTQVVRNRTTQEGMGFLTKTLPRLGKAFDKALAENTKLNSAAHNFAVMRDSEFPRFLGEFFSLVLQPDGTVLPVPCVQAIKIIRQVCYLFYKYKLPYNNEQEQQVIRQFEKTEEDLSTVQCSLELVRGNLEALSSTRRGRYKANPNQVDVAREAKILLSNLFAFFDPSDIYPRHGPGVVATKQKLWGKYLWSNVSDRITEVYPLDAYFYASLGHVCDRPIANSGIKSEDLPARVLLVPKDSRGPRLISCEPVDFQWVQQGLGRAIVELVEGHELTKFNVFFTDQSPNRRGALLGSSTARYSTLDLNEASDRVSTDLVHLLFPEHLCRYLDACRSSSTVLPDGRVIKLKKFAPMGSSLCFPILALTTWAILTAAAPDGDTRDGILVYGDDVIVPTHFASNAMSMLESFGLKINRDKSCTSGFFRESCGCDAYKGEEVTPVRLRTVWEVTPCPGVYSSWISYANSFYDRRCFRVYDLIVERLTAIYGSIPGEDMKLSCPSLRETSLVGKGIRRRWNKNLQKFEFHVRDVSSPSVTKVIDGWSMLLRYFAEKGRPPVVSPDDQRMEVKSPERGTITSETVDQLDTDLTGCLSASEYTSRRASMLVRRWR